HAGSSRRRAPRRGRRGGVSRRVSERTRGPRPGARALRNAARRRRRGVARAGHGPDGRRTGDRDRRRAGRGARPGATVQVFPAADAPPDSLVGMLFETARPRTPVAEATTGPDGRFSLPALPAGGYRFEA